MRTTGSKNVLPERMELVMEAGIMNLSFLASVLAAIVAKWSALYEDGLQPAVRQIGRSLGTIFGLLNTLLLPVELMNEFFEGLLKKSLFCR